MTLSDRFPKGRPVTRGFRCFAPLLVGVVLSTLLAACTTAGTARPVSVISFTYVYGDQSTMVLLQWTSHGPGPVSGTIKIDSIADSSLFASPTDKTTGFTGTVDAKGDVTFTLPVWGTVRGTWQGTDLSMIVPAPGGGQQTARFYPGSQSDYDTAVQQLKEAAGVGGPDSADASAGEAAANLGQDVAILNADVQSLPHLFDNLNQDLASTATGTGATQADAQTALGDAHESSALRCADMNVADDDISIVDDDQMLASTDVDAVLQTITKIRQQSGQVNQDLAQVQHLQPDYRGGSGQPSPTQVQAAITNANSQVTGAISTTNADADKVNDYLTQAYQATTAAAQTDGCGAPQGAPTPVKHIS